MARVALPELNTLTVDTLAETSVFASPLREKEAIEIMMDLSGGMAQVTRAQRKGESGAASDREFCRVSYSGPHWFASWSSDGAERIRVEGSYSRGMQFLDLNPYGLIERSYCSRLDLCIDYGENLNVFRKLYKGPGRWEKVDFRSGSIWRAEGKRFRIYDKAKEAKLRNATRWRMEVSYSSKRSVEYHTRESENNAPAYREEIERRGILDKAIIAHREFGSAERVLDFEPNNEDFKRFVASVAPQVVEDFFRITEGKKNGKRFQSGFI